MTNFVIWALIYGIVTFAATFATWKKYLPVLAEKNNLETVPDKKWHLAAVTGLSLFAMIAGWHLAGGDFSILDLVKLLCAYAVLACVFLTDTEFKLIPNRLTLILASAGVIMLALEYFLTMDDFLLVLASNLIGAVFCFLTLLLTSILSRGGLGAGDVKLMTALGFLCGIYMAGYTLVFACFACGIISAGLLISKVRTMKDSIPFGPFLLIGYAIAMFVI